MNLNRQDISAGLIFVGIGAFFAYHSFSLNLGTPLRMGPGFFPLALALVLIGLGIAICVRSAVDEIEPLQFVPLRSLIPILAAPILFGITIRGLGIVPSIAMVALIASLASRRVTVLRALGITVGLTVFCALVFHYALGLPIPLFGSWIM